MRKPYQARLADFQAQIISTPASQTQGHLLRSFLAHEAITSRNLKRSTLLTPELCAIVSRLQLPTLTGSLPFPPHFSLSIIYSIQDHTLSVIVYNQKTGRIIYSQFTPLNQEINKETV